jgi:hypothetical protein
VAQRYNGQIFSSTVAVASSSCSKRREVKAGKKTGRRNDRDTNRKKEIGRQHERKK